MDEIRLGGQMGVVTWMRAMDEIILNESFINKGLKGKSDVNAIYLDENVWLSQKTMGLLYNVETQTINYHLEKIFADGELDEASVIRKFRITA